MGILLVDVKGLCFTAHYANTQLSYNGKPTGALYGSLKSLSFVNEELKKIQPTFKILFVDDYKPYFRKMYCEEYKANRKRLDRTVLESVGLFQEFLRMSDFPYIAVKGFESDDIIYSLSQTFDSDRIVILSKDTDLYSCFKRDNVYIYKSINKEYTFIDQKWFKYAYGIDPDQWPIVQCLSGGHNGLKGLPKIGEKTSIRLIQSDSLNMQPYKDHLNQNLFLYKLPFFQSTDPVNWNDLFLQYANWQLENKTKRDAKKIIPFLRSNGIAVTEQFQDLLFSKWGVV